MLPSLPIPLELGTPKSYDKFEGSNYLQGQVMLYPFQKHTAYGMKIKYSVPTASQITSPKKVHSERTEFSSLFVFAFIRSALEEQTSLLVG